jgi:hypothetical protein
MDGELDPAESRLLRRSATSINSEICSEQVRLISSTFLTEGYLVSLSANEHVSWAGRLRSMVLVGIDATVSWVITDATERR